jgi:transposase
MVKIFMTFKLSTEELLFLKKLHRTIKDKKNAYKINALILLAEGFSYDQIEKVLLLDERTVRRYKKIYNDKGINGLIQSNYQGGSYKLSTEQISELELYIENNIFSTSADICEHVLSKYGIKYTPNGMTHFLKRRGFTYKKTKIVPSKANKEEQELFVKEYNELREKLRNDEKIYFMDGVHPTHNVMPAYAWIRKGKSKEVKSNSGRQRLNINGVYSPNDNEIIVRKDERINSDSTIMLLKTIEERHPELSRIYIVRDNARYYVSKAVKEYLMNSKIVFIPLPSYSPNLNIIERLWKFFKKKILYNKYYEDFDSFKKAVLEFFNKDIFQYRKELESLLIENFHIFEFS